MKPVIDMANLHFIFNMKNGVDALHMINIECLNIPTCIMEVIDGTPFSSFKDYQLQLLIKNTTGKFPLGTRDEMLDELTTLCFMLPETEYDEVYLLAQSAYVNLHPALNFEYVHLKAKPTTKPKEWCPVKIFVN